MASRRALYTLSVAALVMIILVILDPSRREDSVARTRLVVPEFSRGVVSVSWERPQQPTVTLERRNKEFVLTAPIAAVANSSSVQDVLDTIELLRYSSRSSTRRPELATPRARVIIRFRSGPPVELRVGGRAAEGAGAWVGRDDMAHLVPAHAAKALDRRLGQLRERDVFGVAANAITGLEIQHQGRSLVLSNMPMQVHLDGGGSVRVRSDVARRLGRLLEGMTILQFGDSTVQAEPTGSRIRVVGGPEPTELEVVGRCQDAGQTLVQTAVGLGCVEATELEFVWNLVDAGASLYERRLVSVPGTLRSVSSSVGTARMKLRNGPSGWQQVGASAIGDQAIRAWLIALAALAEGGLRPLPLPSKRGRRRGQISTTDRAGIVTKLEIYEIGGRLFAHRNGEPLWIALRRSASRFSFVQIAMPIEGWPDQRPRK